MRCDLLDLHNILGKKWTYGLIYCLIKSDRSYQEIYELTKRKVNETLLSSRIKELSNYGIIDTPIINGKKRYTLSPFGHDLVKHLNSIKGLIEDQGKYTPPRCQGKDCSKCPAFCK